MVKRPYVSYEMLDRISCLPFSKENREEMTRNDMPDRNAFCNSNASCYFIAIDTIIMIPAVFVLGNC